MTHDHNHTEGTASGGTIYDSPLSAEERLQVWRDRKVLVSQPAVWTEPGEGQPCRGWQGGRAPATSTYFQEQGLADDEIAGGRFAPKRGPDPVPRQPAHSPWASDAAGIEPPLGERVDDLGDITTLDGHSRDPDAIPWNYGEPPTESHASYDLDPNTNAEGSLTSVTGAQTPEQLVPASVEVCAPVPPAEPPSRPSGPGVRRF